MLKYLLFSFLVTASVAINISAATPPVQNSENCDGELQPSKEALTLYYQIVQEIYAIAEQPGIETPSRVLSTTNNCS